jgi:L-lactate dehydrogenase complex protein LldG
LGTREEILKSIARNQPLFKEDAVINITEDTGNSRDLTKLFIKAVENHSGKVVQVGTVDDIKNVLYRDLQGTDYVVNTINGIGPANAEITSFSHATSLNHIYKAYIRGELGISENGAVWIDESLMINRLLPFICQHLVIVLYEDEIVGNMHDAYKKIDITKEGFGVFIAGPSKTADIEQSLVIGAHGARSLIVYLVRSRN